MDTTYQPQQIEETWYKTWEKNNYFAPTGTGDAYSIMIPPPNVTGSLHMGHAFQHTIMDALIRYQRMQGKNTLWQVGTDHAGIATQMVVERKLAQETEQSRHDLGRDAFIDKIWQWKEESGDTITRQMRRLGNSVDWSTERFTMDPGFYKAVQAAFIQLYDDNLIYRGKRLVNWDPKLQTAISDLEVENKEVQGKMWYLHYPLADNITTAAGDNFIVVGTTRPETMLGDTGVAVNPKDERYADLIGKEIILPLVNRRIPIVADRHADMEKGSGCVKITPAHDFNDHEVGKRCQLPMINILSLTGDILSEPETYNTDGTANPDLEASIPAAYQGLERFAARKAILADLKAQDLLLKIEENPMTVPYGDRSGVVVEPMLTDQWFCAATTLAKPAVAAVENGNIKFVPKQYENMYFAWMRDIQDWCISRQLWWGHRIPAFYDEAGNIYVAENEASTRSKYGLDDELSLRQDNDVLDTWFSSALWTFATLGWPEETQRLQKFHPTNVLVTGFDIIFFWVARMIMFSLYFMKDKEGKPQVPFKTVYVTGLIRDENGDKMSKSKGNVLDPLDMIDGIELPELLTKRTGNMMQPQLAEKIAKGTEKQFPEGIAAHGTDALRFTLAALATTGRDINWDMKRLNGYRNFCNKIWNAANYVLMHCEGHDINSEAEKSLSLADEWIIDRLNTAKVGVQASMDMYRFDLASQELYDFIWNDYCSWYLELSKPILWDENASAEALNGTRHTLVQVLETTLRLAHPLIPFITEELWQKLKPLSGAEGDSIMLAKYPIGDRTYIPNQDIETEIEWLKDIITRVRIIRGEHNISPAKLLTLYLADGNEYDKALLERNKQYLSKLASLESITWITADKEPPLCATGGFVGEMEVLVPMAGLIDKKVELARLQKSLDKLVQEIKRFQSKLSNERFVANAPEDVITKEKEKLAKAESDQAKLVEQQQKIALL